MQSVTRRQSEGYEVLLRRFSRELQQARVLSELKRRRFRYKEPSRRKLRESARRKAERLKVKRGY